MLKCNRWFALAIVLAVLPVSACARSAPPSSPSPQPTQPPVIVKLTSEVTRLRTWNTTTIDCVAEDPEGGQLTYVWAATGGKIQGKGKAIGWTAPGVKGEYVITVRVITDKGGQAEKSISISVFCCESE